MTKTEMAEALQEYLDYALIGICIFKKTKEEVQQEQQIFDRHFKELFEDFKVKIQEKIEEEIGYEEQEFVEETTDAEAFGNGIMEGE